MMDAKIMFIQETSKRLRALDIDGVFCLNGGLGYMCHGNGDMNAQLNAAVVLLSTVVSIWGEDEKDMLLDAVVQKVRENMQDEGFTKQVQKGLRASSSGEAIK